MAVLTTGLRFICISDQTTMESAFRYRGCASSGAGEGGEVNKFLMERDLLGPRPPSRVGSGVAAAGRLWGPIDGLPVAPPATGEVRGPAS
jgi:hypothetical protein